MFKHDLSQFTPDERKRIREQLKSNNVNVRCVFIQELNFQYIHINGWRKEFFKVVEISKNSRY